MLKNPGMIVLAANFTSRYKHLKQNFYARYKNKKEENENFPLKNHYHKL